LDKPICCEEEMSFVMDNKVKELFECLHCRKLVLRNKRTKEEVWYGEIFSLDALMRRFPHLVKE